MSKEIIKLAKSFANDRAHYSVLVVCAQGSTSSQVRQTMKSLGFLQMSTAPSHMQGLDKVKIRKFTHIVFDAKVTDMPTIDFVKQIIEMDATTILIAISEQPFRI